MVFLSLMISNVRCLFQRFFNFWEISNSRSSFSASVLKAPNVRWTSLQILFFRLSNGFSMPENPENSSKAADQRVSHLCASRRSCFVWPPSSWVAAVGEHLQSLQTLSDVWLVCSTRGRSLPVTVICSYGIKEHLDTVLSTFPTFLRPLLFPFLYFPLLFLSSAVILEFHRIRFPHRRYLRRTKGHREKVP